MCMDVQRLGVKHSIHCVGRETEVLLYPRDLGVSGPSPDLPGIQDRTLGWEAEHGPLWGAGL